jgi:hypothetical protein
MPKRFIELDLNTSGPTAETLGLLRPKRIPIPAIPLLSNLILRLPDRVITVLEFRIDNFTLTFESIQKKVDSLQTSISMNKVVDRYKTHL